MSNEFEPDEPATEESLWMQNDDIELDEMCSEYRRIESEKKLHESVAKELEPKLKSLATMIQARMGEHKHVRTSCGYTLEWKPFKRKGYTVSDAEGERWQLRSPY